MIYLLLLEENFNVYTRLNVNTGDGLDIGGRRVDINDALVNAHLKQVPGVGTLSIRRLARGNPELLGGNADRSRNLESLGHAVVLQVLASPSPAP